MTSRKTIGVVAADVCVTLIALAAMWFGRAEAAKIAYDGFVVIATLNGVHLGLTYKQRMEQIKQQGGSGQ